MKKLLFILIICFPLFSLSQDIDKLGLNDEILLNENEAEYLNKYCEKLSYIDSCDFQKKRILFAYGNSARIISKKEYFNKYVIPRIKSESEMSNYIAILNKEEFKKSGGIYAIVVAWSKIGLTKSRRKKIIKKLSRENKKINTDWYKNHGLI